MRPEDHRGWPGSACFVRALPVGHRDGLDVAERVAAWRARFANHLFTLMVRGVLIEYTVSACLYGLTAADTERRGGEWFAALVLRYGDAVEWVERTRDEPPAELPSDRQFDACGSVNDPCTPVCLDYWTALFALPLPLREPLFRLMRAHGEAFQVSVFAATRPAPGVVQVNQPRPKGRGFVRGLREVPDGLSPYSRFFVPRP